MRTTHQDAQDAIGRNPREDGAADSTFVVQMIGAVCGLSADSSRQDADESVLFAREVEHKIAEEITREYPELPLADGPMLGLVTVPDGAITYFWNLAEPRGLVKWAANCDDEIPWSSLGRAEQTGRLENIVGGYKWCHEDIRRASFAGVQLVPALRSGSARAHSERWDQTIAWGEEALGLVGLFNHPNSTHIAAPLNEGATSTLWTQKTADEILADVNLIVNSIPQATNEERMATDVIMSPDMLRYTQQTRISGDNNADFIFTLIQRAHPNITFSAMRYMDASNPRSRGNLTGDAMFAFNRAPTFVQKVRAFLFRTLPPQSINLDVRVPGESKIGGVRLTEPLTTALMQGLFN